MDQPDQPLTRRERIARERAAQADQSTSSHPATEARSTFSAQAPRRRAQAGNEHSAADYSAHNYAHNYTDPATPQAVRAGSAGNSAVSDTPTAGGARPFVRPAERNSRRPEHYSDSPGAAYGSGPTGYNYSAGGYDYSAGPATEPNTTVLPSPASGASGVATLERKRTAPPEKAPLGIVRGTIRGFGELCITSGLILILFVVWQLWWTDIEANRDNSDLASDLVTRWQENPDNELPEDPDTPAIADLPAENEAFGIMYIPRFGEDYYRTMAEGVSLEPVLNRMGVGHYPSTARPGEVGNFAIAGHRVTYGKPLNLIAEMRPGDPIVVQTKEGFYTYTMRNFEIVLPDQTEVLAPVPAEPEYKGKDRIMTMTACNPMFSARERYVVYAELTEWRPSSEGPPAAIADSSAFAEAGGN